MSLGGGGSAGRSTTTSTPDPTTQRLNTLQADEFEAARNATGGIASFLKPNPLALPGEAERATLGKLADFTNRPLLNPFETAGLDRFQSAADPTGRLNAARDILQSITTPALTNTAIAGGFGGRSGALLEALSRSGKELALPIAQDVANIQQAQGSQLLALGPGLESRETGRLSTALSAEGAPRLAAFQESLRPQNLYLSQLLGIPTGGGSTQTTTGTTPDTNLLRDIFVPLASAGLIRFGNCWIAEAVYGVNAEETGYARHYLTFGAPAWFRRVYLKLALLIPHGLTSRHRLIARVAMERGKLALGVA